jgi:hypothetical protein
MNVTRVGCPHPPVSADRPESSERQGVTARAKISRKPSIAVSGSSSSPNSLERRQRKASCARSDRSRKGWSPERRVRQAVLIRNWAPWRRSTGPKTEAGKARCSQNALKHGFRSRATIREYQKIRYVLRLAARNIAMLRLHIRARQQAARPQIKFKPRYVRALAVPEGGPVRRSPKDEAGLPLARPKRYTTTNDHRP